ncbi:hypothetical protein CRG98_016773 [Punica granatum]|uniref:Reverse transcriptase domain-containing protein n=1 Tax=Punica granatum TaxID=22663 RepID=A0A2I0K2P9_PUNGR|nr:hypothetical protein CRG98_016773 [Punica granatum]
MFEQCIGEFGWAQLAQAMLASLAWFFDAQQTFISMFTDSDLSSSCTDPNSIIWPYATLCFVCGFGLAAIGTCALMLSMELVRRRWQGMVGMMGFLVFTLGFLSLPMGTAIPALLYCGLVYFFVHESLRLFLLVLTTLSVVVSTICILQGEVWERLQLVFELTSYASSCMAMCALLIYTLELFPTCVRNSALSMVRQANVLGRRAFSPVLVEAGGASGGALSYGVTGAVVGICRLFTECLPETQGGKDIGDNVRLAHELVKGHKRHGVSPKCVIKADIIRAFDLVEWRFLLNILRVIEVPVAISLAGLKYVPQELCIPSWLMEVLKAISRVRRVPNEESPSFPFFSLSLMRFFQLLTAAAEKGHISYHPNCSKVQITHLGFADDLLVFMKGPITSMQSLL